MVSLFFKGSSLPFVGYKVIDIEGDTITPIIKWEVDPQDKNVVNFTAESSTGSDIDWSQSKWTFGDGSETQYGVTATHKYGLDANSREYKVSLTLYRRQDNGSSETKTATQTVRIADDKIFPVIKAKLHNNGYLVLSAEESEGRGLLLDRSVWIFEGQGDSSSYSKAIKGGVIKKKSYDKNSLISNSTQAKMDAQIRTGINFDSSQSAWGKYAQAFTGLSTFFSVSAGMSSEMGTQTQNNINSSDTVDDYDYSDFKDDNQSFSTQNTITGAMCKRDVNGAKSIRVTLFVYRSNPDGSLKGESITVDVIVESAKGGNGVIYGK